jgi:hypothetical protein
MKFFRVLVLIVLLAPFALSQNVRFSTSFPSVSSSTAIPYLIANTPPNSPVLAVCNSPANQVPCTNYATVYNSVGVACSNGAQDTPDPQPSACQSTGDAQGNIGWWAPPGTYTYTVCVANSCFGPYTVTLGGSGGACVGTDPGDLCYYDGAHWTVLTGNAATPISSAVIALTEDQTGNPAWHAVWTPAGSVCETGLGDGLNAIPSGTYRQLFCVNQWQADETIIAVRCYTDNAGTSTLDAKNNAGTELLVAPIVCNNTKTGGGRQGTLVSTVPSFDIDDAINFTFVSDGTSTQTTWTVSLSVSHP